MRVSPRAGGFAIIIEPAGDGEEGRTSSNRGANCHVAQTCMRCRPITPASQRPAPFRRLAMLSSGPGALGVAYTTRWPVEADVLPGAGIFERFDVREDAGQREGGPNFVVERFEQVVALLDRPPAGDQHMQRDEAAGARLPGSDRVE